MIACKKMRKYCLFPIVLILTLIPCVLPAQGISPETNSLSSQLDTLIKYQLPAGSNVSVSAYDLTANKVLYDYQADKLSRPASTMKLLTTITALARPEADEPFRTEVWYKGVIERDTLKGDIYVVGGFDPEFDDEALDSLVGSVARLPFSVVQGRIYGDVSMKDSLYWGSGWLWDDTPHSFQPYLSPLMHKVMRHVWNVRPLRLITRWPIQRKPVLPLPDVSAYPATGWRTAMNWRYRVMWMGGVPVR